MADAVSRGSAVCTRCMPIRLNQPSIGCVKEYQPQISCLLSHSYNPDNMNETTHSRSSADIYLGMVCLRVTQIYFAHGLSTVDYPTARYKDCIKDSLLDLIFTGVRVAEKRHTAEAQQKRVARKANAAACHLHYSPCPHMPNVWASLPGPYWPLLSHLWTHSHRPST